MHIILSTQQICEVSSTDITNSSPTLDYLVSDSTYASEKLLENIDAGKR